VPFAFLFGIPYVHPAVTRFNRRRSKPWMLLKTTAKTRARKPTKL
jgi:hypothetical protein